MDLAYILGYMLETHTYYFIYCLHSGAAIGLY